MPRRAKQLGVTPDQRKGWLRRQESGETPPEIAVKDGYDVRTVRKHIEKAMEEREAREMRSIVLRDAVQAHFADLTIFAERLQTEVARGNRVSQLATDRKYGALKQHVPRSLLWKLLDSWDKAHGEIEQARNDLKLKVAADFTTGPAVRRAFAGGTPNTAGVVDLFAQQAEIWKLGGKGLDLDSNFKAAPGEAGLVDMKIGAYPVGTCPEGRVTAVKKALLAYKTTITACPESQRLLDGDKALKRLSPDIDEELAVITLRRVVPGRCKYCPV